MKTGSRLLAFVVVGVAILTFAPVASAAPTSTSFTIAGYEYAFTSTVGSFAGNGIGNARDTALWTRDRAARSARLNADLHHGWLG